MFIRRAATSVGWQKSSFSGANGCVELRSAAGAVLVRDSKLQRRSPVLHFSHAEWEAFLLGVKNGEFDQLI